MTLPGGLLPARASASHKGDYGHVCVAAGSVGLTGAAALCARGALRVGVGLVTVATPASQQPVLAVKLTEAITRALPETKEQSLSLQALPALIRVLDGMDVLVVGPGLSRQPQTQQLVRQLLPAAGRPCVVDADALNALVEDLGTLKRCVHPLIVTPHPGEMGRLIGLSAADVQRDRERIAKEFATRYNTVTVLKGHHTIVANVDGELYVNDTGNPGMASGGMGDILAGMIGGLLAQKLSAFDAARLAVFAHGLAGDLSAEQRGHVGLIASDLLDTIPLALRRYQQSA